MVIMYVIVDKNDALSFFDHMPLIFSCKANAEKTLRVLNDLMIDNHSFVVNDDPGFRIAEMVEVSGVH